jgi:hypothetical protein
MLSALLLGSVVPAISAPLDTTLLERTCSDCHYIEEIIEKRAYMNDWKKIVDRMAAYDSSEISHIDKLKVLKFINENLALDGPAAKAGREQK